MTTPLSEIWFERDGVRLFAVHAGDGRAIVLVHGGLADHRAAWRIAAPLAARAHVIAPDLRGSGRSIHHGALDWDTLADDVAALVRHLGLDRAVIGGVSFGAACALRVALRHPAIVDGVVLLTPAFGGADLPLTPAQVAAMHAMGDAGRRIRRDGLAALYPLFDAQPAAIQARARELIATLDPESVVAHTAFLDACVQPFDRAAELAAIDAPVLLVPGSDPTHPPEVAEHLRRHLRDCAVRAADPTGYVDVIGAWLSER